MANVVDSYSEANVSGYNAVYSVVSHAQAFAGDGSELGAAEFYGRKNGSPTGSLFFKVYAMTGTFGTSAIPTGSAIATSDALDISTISTSNGLINIPFSGANQITLSSGTNYCLSVEYAGGDGSNNFLVAKDYSSPTHPGNSSFKAPTWTAEAGGDAIFYVFDNAPFGTQTNDTRDVRVTSDGVVSDTRDVRATGAEESFATNDVRIEASAGASLDRDVRLFSTSTSNTTRDARLTGTNTGSTNRDSRITGINGSDRAQDIRINGVSGASYTQDVRVTGVLASSDSRDVRIRGYISAASGIRDSIQQNDETITLNMI